MSFQFLVHELGNWNHAVRTVHTDAREPVILCFNSAFTLQAIHPVIYDKEKHYTLNCCGLSDSPGFKPNFTVIYTLD